MSTLSISAKVSDRDLREAVWTHVAGHKRDWRDSITESITNRNACPAYESDLNALLPLLETAPGGKHTITYVAPHHSCRWWRYEVAIHTATAPDYVGRAETLARAGCLALLASRGVTILP